MQQHAGQNTNAGVEAWHSLLKLGFLLRKKYLRGRHIGYLLYTLLQRVLPYFQQRGAVAALAFEKNNAQGKETQRAILRARDVPDARVGRVSSDGTTVTVASSDSEQVYTVRLNDMWGCTCAVSTTARCAACAMGMRGLWLTHSWCVAGDSVQAPGEGVADDAAWLH